MLDTFPAAAVFALVVAAGLAVLYALTVVPVVLALSMAERRDFPEGRWAAVAVLGVLVALALALGLRRADVGAVLQVVPLGAAFLGPALLWVLEPGQRIGGRAGRHEPPL